MIQLVTFNLDLKPLLERFYKVEVKVVSGSGTDEMINFYTEIPSFKVVKYGF